MHTTTFILFFYVTFKSQTLFQMPAGVPPGMMQFKRAHVSFSDDKPDLNDPSPGLCTILKTTQDTEFLTVRQGYEPLMHWSRPSSYVNMYI